MAKPTIMTAVRIIKALGPASAAKAATTALTSEIEDTAEAKHNDATKIAISASK